MIKYIKSYSDTVRKKLDSEILSREDLEYLSTDILEHIKFFQHERLIHLLVTILFAFLSVFGVIGMIVYPNWMTILFTALVLIPEIFYISHYYKLENNVQQMYKLYDVISRKR